MTTIMQGDQYGIPFQVLLDGVVADKSFFSEVEFVIHNIRKTITDGSIDFDAESGEFIFPLTQKESMNLPDPSSAQCRVKLKDSGDVIGVDLGQIHVDISRSKAVI